MDGQPTDKPYEIRTPRSAQRRLAAAVRWDKPEEDIAELRAQLALANVAKSIRDFVTKFRPIHDVERGQLMAAIDTGRGTDEYLRVD